MLSDKITLLFLNKLPSILSFKSLRIVNKLPFSVKTNFDKGINQFLNKEFIPFQLQVKKELENENSFEFCDL